MKVYLAVPLARGRNKNIAREIAAILYGLDCKLASEWVTWSDPNLKLNPKEIYARDVNAIKKCNIFVAEITKPSTGIGIELMTAKKFKKKIICVYKDANVSNMVLGDARDYHNKIF